MLHLSKSKLGNEKSKNKKIEKVCGTLAFLKAHPADVWLRWTRQPRTSKRNRRNRPESMPARYLTEMVDGKFVTQRIMKVTPGNRPALRGPYPVLSAEQKKAWDEMAEIEAGIKAWDTDFSPDSANLDSWRGFLDYIAFDPHSETAEARQEDHYAIPAAVTACSAEAEAEVEPKVNSVLKTHKPEKAKDNIQADDAQGRKRKRDGRDDNDDNGAPVKKASR